MSLMFYTITNHYLGMQFTIGFLQFLMIQCRVYH